MATRMQTNGPNGEKHLKNNIRHKLGVWITNVHIKKFRWQWVKKVPTNKT